MSQEVPNVDLAFNPELRQSEEFRQAQTDLDAYFAARPFKDANGRVHQANGKYHSEAEPEQAKGNQIKIDMGVQRLNDYNESMSLAYGDMTYSQLAEKLAESEVNNDKTTESDILNVLLERIDNLYEKQRLSDNDEKADLNLLDRVLELKERKLEGEKKKKLENEKRIEQFRQKEQSRLSASTDDSTPAVDTHESQDAEEESPNIEPVSDAVDQHDSATADESVSDARHNHNHDHDHDTVAELEGSTDNTDSFSRTPEISNEVILSSLQDELSELADRLGEMPGGIDEAFLDTFAEFDSTYQRLQAYATENGIQLDESLLGTLLEQANIQEENYQGLREAAGLAAEIEEDTVENGVSSEEEIEAGEGATQRFLANIKQKVQSAGLLPAKAMGLVLSSPRLLNNWTNEKLPEDWSDRKKQAAKAVAGVAIAATTGVIAYQLLRNYGDSSALGEAANGAELIDSQETINSGSNLPEELGGGEAAKTTESGIDSVSSLPEELGGGETTDIEPAPESAADTNDTNNNDTETGNSDSAVYDATGNNQDIQDTASPSSNSGNAEEVSVSPEVLDSARTVSPGQGWYDVFQSLEIPQMHNNSFAWQELLNELGPDLELTGRAYVMPNGEWGISGAEDLPDEVIEKIIEKAKQKGLL